jgi:hypothetical protein
LRRSRSRFRSSPTLISYSNSVGFWNPAMSNPSERRSRSAPVDPRSRRADGIRAQRSVATCAAVARCGRSEWRSDASREHEQHDGQDPRHLHPRYAGLISIHTLLQAVERPAVRASTLRPATARRCGLPSAPPG